MNQIDGNTKLFGIIGHPVKHSLSPLIHNAAFQKIGYNGVYIPFDIENPGIRTKESFHELGIHGLSVTIPHKNWAFQIADIKDPLSEICRASNTLIRNADGKFSAYNTDGPGALNALYTKIDSLSGKRILMIGYGGSASAIAHAILLNDPPESLYIGGRNQNKIKSFIETFNVHENLITEIKESDEHISSDDIDIVINTTPLGMKFGSVDLPLKSDFITEKHIVFDIVYIPRDTPLIKLAKSKNAAVVYGYLMLLHQAVLQFELFTGEKAPVDLMESVMTEALNI